MQPFFVYSFHVWTFHITIAIRTLSSAVYLHESASFFQVCNMAMANMAMASRPYVIFA